MEKGFAKSKFNIRIMLINIFLLTISIVLVLLNSGTKTLLIVSIWVLFLNMYGIYRSKNNIGLLIIHIFLLWSNYSIFLVNIFSPIYNFFTRDLDVESLITMFNILLIFTVIFVVLTPKSNKMTAFFEKGNNNLIISIGTIILLSILLLYFLIKSDGYSGAKQGNPIIEYSSLIMIIGLYFSSKNKIAKALITALALGIAITNFFNGGRITGMQICIALLLIYFGHKIKFISLVFGIVIFFILFSSIGVMRDDFAFDFNSLKLIVNSIKTNKLAFDTSYSAFYTSSTFLKYSEMVSVSYRLKLFWNFFGSIFFGTNYIPNSNLANITHEYFFHYYGGILPYFGYFYLGYFGVIIFACYSSLLQRIVNKREKNGFCTIVSISVCSTVPRWYLYFPSTITRSIFLIFIIYFICKFICELTNKNNEKYAYNLVDL